MFKGHHAMIEWKLGAQLVSQAGAQERQWSSLHDATKLSKKKKKITVNIIQRYKWKVSDKGVIEH